MELLSIARGLLAIVVLIGITYLFSANKKAIDWQLVGKGLLVQIILGLLILKVPFVKDVFQVVADFFVNITRWTEYGASFVLGGLMDDTKVGYIFAAKVLPTIIFFSAISSCLYYLGILQVVIKGFAWVMTKALGISGAESLAAAANVFIGQTEAPLMVKPYLEKMSKSEILCLMTGGMATIAGGVFAAFISFLGEQYAIHFLTASIMSAPAAIVAAKILYPETRDDVDMDLNLTSEEVGANLLDAIARGSTDGVKLAVNVGVMIIVFMAFVMMMNEALMWGVGSWTGLNEYVINTTGGAFEGFNFNYVMGIVFSPIAWILGVAAEDMMIVGQLLGKKTVINEFVAYLDMQKVLGELQPKSKVICTYALCGFANFASIGIQIGGIGAIAPGRKVLLAQFGIKALIGGTIACFLTAAIAGAIVDPSTI